MEIRPDLVVLVTGMVPRKDTKIADVLKIPVGRDKFFNEIHPKLRPVETVINGVYIAGACQGPKNITETMMSALTAASKAISTIGLEEIELEPHIATVNLNTCKWCGKCAEVCTYGAIEQGEHDGKAIASVNKALCKGCGACGPVCPVDAIDIIGYNNSEIETMIDAFAREVK